MVELDPLDRRLLRALQDDARLTNAELGAKVHLSASQVSRRRRRLELEGVILGYHARVDRASIGLDIVAIVAVTLAHHDPGNATRLATLLADSPEVLEALMLTGESDYSVKIVVADLAALARFINETLLPHEAVQNVRTSIVLQTLKETGSVPLGR